MDVYTTENEQLEQLRQLWKKYGVSTIAGILIALLASYAWRQWTDMREQSLIQASVRYEQLLADIAHHDGTAFEKDAHAIMRQYPKTTYAQLTALLLADRAVHEHHLNVAEELLKGIMHTADLDSLRALSAVRLARIQLNKHQEQDALNTLNSVKNKAFLALAEEVKGDVYVSLHQTKNARDAYQTALNLLPALRTERPIIEMKLNDLPLS